ncbi:MAG: dipeptide ABC transporter ATP-binding protein [Actinobacteria bacterium]|nr:dipeptide ABC transporter ATP-binding protein [Actinomycetota bacterium]
MNHAPMLSVRHATKHFPVRGGVLLRTIGHVHAVDDVSFEVRPGETFGLVGESGCGKTTIGRLIVRLHTPTAGDVFFEDQNVLAWDRKLLARNVQYIFQDPYGSLNPRLTVGSIIGEGLTAHALGTRAERAERAREMMNVVGLNSQYAQRYPHEFSGGQRQRIGIARALVLRPKFVVCDEPVSALDVSIQSQILNLLKDLQGEFGLTYLFIAHNLAVVRYVCDRVAVMYLGRLVEMAETDELFERPLHPYTQGLIAAVPATHPSQKRDRAVVRGELPSPMNPPRGCRFHTRCPLARDVCREVDPDLIDYGQQHFAACHVVHEQLGGTATPPSH